MQPPGMNILLIHSDQHRYDCIRANGLRDDIQTSHLDRLCAEGTTFTRAYSTIPICTPARASLLTGAWPTTHGCFCIPTAEIDRAARRDLPTITQLLTDEAYRVSWVGKYHGELETRPDFSVGVGTYKPNSDYRKYRQEKGIPPLEKPRGFFGDTDRPCPPEHSSLAWQANQVIDELQAHAQGRFFIRWDPPEPHLPCNPTAPFADRFADSPIPPWQSFPDPLENKPAAQKRQLEIWGVEGWSWEQWLPTVRHYYAIIAEMDHHIGRILDTLDELGLAEDTLVLYSSDHGDFCGGHGQIDKHFNFYEDVAQIPLIARAPGRIPAGQTCDAFCSNSIDLARTILKAADCEPPESFVGQDLIALAADPSTPRQPYAFSQYFGTESGAYSMRMLRDERYKFVYHPVGDHHELYDLESDPGEITNQVNNPACAAVLKRLKHDLWDEMHNRRDPLASAWTKIELQNAPSPADTVGPS